MRILILGASGMLGSCLTRYFGSVRSYSVCSIVRNKLGVERVKCCAHNAEIVQMDPLDLPKIEKQISSFRPDSIINCIGVVKQSSAVEDIAQTISVNSMFPHMLSGIAKNQNCRLIHFSTDCVFSGKLGNYSERDFEDAGDIYGRSKLLGEVVGDHCLTLRTSIIGHELSGKKSLLEWFLSQNDRVSGYRNAIFSGFPTVEIARILDEFVLPNKGLSGIYHLASSPINKFDLLTQISKIYGKDIAVIPDDTVNINRSLDGSRFEFAVGFKPKSWAEQLNQMYEYG